MIGATQTIQVPAASSAEAQFADYVLRSLTRIDQQSSVAKVPQSTPSSIVNTPAVAALPSISGVETGSRNRVNSGPRTTTPNRVFVPSANSLPKPNLVPVTPPTVSSAATNPEYAAAAVQKPQPLPLTSSADTSQHVLKGVMDLGNQSVALIESNGSTRRVQMGEPLNEGGLTLVEVQAGKAVVQKGSEVRSLSVGDRF